MRSFVAFVLLLCASTALGTILTGNFVETKARDPNAFTNGTFYYLYDESNLTKSRLRFEYNLPGGVIVSNLYDYEIGAMYSMCPGSCTADTKTDVPDKWWYDSSMFTKTSDQEGGKFWYTRKATASTQMKRILMSEDTTPTTNSLAAIEFQDGRTIRVSGIRVDPSDVPSTSSKFKTDSGLTCPVPTCSMFADIVFVLDFSGSVGRKGWDQTIEFVIGVLNSFKFGDSDAAAAVVKFTYAATIVASGSNNGKPTVTTNVDNLISAVNVSMTPYYTTCMGTGLEVAMQMFDNSPRRLYGNKPQNIVIAVTDGVDNDCGSAYYGDHFRRTRNAAEKLKGPDYEAFFMSIGVAISSSYVPKLQEIASDLGGGVKAYFPVTSYNEIKGAVDKIFSPLCEQFHTECGLDCHGFCGCGDCMCPFCNVTGDKCDDYQCEARAGTSDGCVLTPLITCPEDDWCTQHVCDATSGSAQCKELHTCDEYVSKNPGSCRSISCDKNGKKCVVNRDHSVCKQFDTPCMIWECAGENETAIDEGTGCRIKENKTATCESQGKGTCLEYTCSVVNGSCIVSHDECYDPNDGCVSSRCEKSGDKYKCVDHPIPGPANTTCVTYKCDKNVGGWYVAETHDVDGCRNCNDGSSFTSCLSSDAAEEARKKNEADPNVCYTVECRNKACVVKNQEKPKEDGKKDTACWTNMCRYDDTEGWRWVREPSQESVACKNDACYNWTCDDEKGCVPTDTCGVKSNECKTFFCKTNDDGSKECTYENKTLVDSECMYEVCIDDVKYTKYKNSSFEELSKACPNENKCKVPMCSEKGQCVFRDATPPEGLFSNDQIECAVCKPETGEWSFGCDDGLFCTNDFCGVGGKCRHTDLNCFKILNMSANSDKDKCFMAVCNEGNDRYECKRKKKNGVYVDVCGNCIRQDGYDGSSDESDGDTVACVDAPEEPVLKEPLAAAAIAMIVLLAVLVGGVLAASTIIGTKTLLERARAANNQSAHSNPLFEDNVKEMANPTFMEEVDVEA